MAKVNYYDNQSESANWNVAKKYSELKILSHLIYADEYELIATFGTSSLVQEFTADDNSKSFARIMAIKRLAKEIEMIINNSFFAMKKTDRPKMEELKTKLKSIKDLLPSVERKQIDQRTSRTSIAVNEENFEICLRKLVEVKTDLNEPLNDNNLIYGNIEEFDIDKIKAAFMKEAIEKA